MCLLNPVIDLAGMLTVSDIPDWTMAECGIAYDLKKMRFVTPELFLKMHESSPSSLVDHVCTPTLLLLGKSDRRVPYSQGLNWFYALRSRKVECSMLTFPDVGHRLDTIEADKYGFEAAAKFFLSKMRALK